MDELAASAFPFPTVVEGIRRDGSIWPIHELCRRCTNRECERVLTPNGPAVCHRGLSYSLVRDQYLVFGVPVRDDPTKTEAQRKAVKKSGAEATTRGQFRTALSNLEKALTKAELIQEAENEARLDVERSREDYMGELVGKLAEPLEHALGQFHDYRALAGSVMRNLDVTIEHLKGGARLREDSHELVAAYWSTVLMIDKLDTAMFLLRPDQITAVVDAPFRFHGLVTKYARIYKSEFDSKNVRHHFVGESRAEVHSNSRAISVFPLNFIDNALKYAPSGSDVLTRFEETDDTIVYSVESLGPRIEPSERRRIFEPFYRAEAAKAHASEGMGFGLAVCRLVAERIGSSVEVWQAEEPESGRLFRTRFTVELPRRHS